MPDASNSHPSRQSWRDGDRDAGRSSSARSWRKPSASSSTGDSQLTSQRRRRILLAASTIGVRSEPGHGSVFRILLPLYEGPILPGEQRLVRRPPAAGGRVLVIDDEEEVSRMAARMLEAMGHQVFVRREGNAALDFYREAWRDIDLIVLDMSMPRMGGRETFLALREINRDAIVLLTSGFSIDDEVQDLLDTGASGFIQKPFSIREFATVVEEASRRAASRPVPEPGDP